MKNIKAIIIIYLVFGAAFYVFSKTIHLKTENLNECFDITSFLTNSKDEHFLFSFRTNKMFKFDKNGEFVKYFGGRGVGPGELKRVLFMSHNPSNDFLYFPEAFSGLSRVSVFDSEGNFKNYMDLELKHSEKNSILKLVFLEDGSFYTVLSERVGWEPRGKVYLTREKYSLLYFDKKGKLKSTVYTTFQNREVADRPRMGGPRVLFLPSIICRKTPPGNIYIGKTDENEFHLYSKNGIKLCTSKLDMKRELLSEEEFNSAKSELSDNLKGDSRMHWLAKQMIKLKYKPIYHNFFVLPQYLAVIKIERESNLGLTKQSRVILFDEKGREITMKKIKGYVMNVSNNRLYIKEYNEDGDELFRIEDFNVQSLHK